MEAPATCFQKALFLLTSQLAAQTPQVMPPPDCAHHSAGTGDLVTGNHRLRPREPVSYSLHKCLILMRLKASVPQVWAYNKQVSPGERGHHWSDCSHAHTATRQSYSAT